MRNIFLLENHQIKEFLDSIGEPRFRASQVWKGIYKDFYTEWNQFTNIPKILRQRLTEDIQILPFELDSENWTENNETHKVLFKLNDGNYIETVHLKSDERNTICISTQSGCPVGCVFCATGGAGFFRSLSASEIIAQVYYFANLLKMDNEKITNIVLMGMGEPFLNYQETLKAINIFNTPDYFDIGARRITVSTIGIPEKIDAFAEIGKQFNLAISLHAPNDELRQQLIPIAVKYSLHSIISSAENYIEKTNRRITYEYVLIRGINSKPGHANQLVHLVKGQNCHVNLIALNENPHFPGEAPPKNEIQAFSQILLSNKIPTTIRNSQGSKIQAGCGQLAGKLSGNTKGGN